MATSSKRSDGSSNKSGETKTVSKKNPPKKNPPKKNPVPGVYHKVNKTSGK